MSILSTIQQKLVGAQQAFGVTILLKQEGYELALVELTQKKGSITIAKDELSLTLEMLKNIIEKGALIGIRLTGKGILSKTFEGDIPEAQLLSQLLPNAKPEDFHLQTFQHNHKTFASIIRKEVLNEWIVLFQDYFLVSIELGNDAQEVLSDYIAIQENSDETLLIGDQQLNKSNYSSFSVAFKSLLNLSRGTLHLHTIDELRDEYFQKRLFHLAGVSLLGLSLIVLLANFILFQNYRAANAEISQEAAKYMSINATKDSLLQVIGQREEFLNKTGWLKDHTISKQLDKIASIMPPQLLLTRITFNPKDEKISRETRKNQFKTGTIYISGETSNTVALNQWVTDINKLKEVSKTDIIKYEYDSRNRVGLFNIAVINK